MIFHCDLDLEDSKTIFCMTLWPMMMHHHTTFGGTRCSGSEGIIWTVIDILKFCCDLDFEDSNSISS